MAEASITCPKCGMTSHNHLDVEHRYCGACHQFHEIPDPGMPLPLICFAGGFYDGGYAIVPLNCPHFYFVGADVVQQYRVDHAALTGRLVGEFARSPGRPGPLPCLPVGHQVAADSMAAFAADWMAAFAAD